LVSSISGSTFCASASYISTPVATALDAAIASTVEVAVIGTALTIVEVRFLWTAHRMMKKPQTRASTPHAARPMPRPSTTASLDPSPTVCADDDVASGAMVGFKGEVVGAELEGADSGGWLGAKIMSVMVRGASTRTTVTPKTVPAWLGEAARILRADAIVTSEVAVVGVMRASTRRLAGETTNTISVSEMPR